MGLKFDNVMDPDNAEYYSDSNMRVEDMTMVIELMKICATCSFFGNKNRHIQQLGCKNENAQKTRRTMLMDGQEKACSMWVFFKDGSI